MSILGAGQWQLEQAQRGLASAAGSETSRNITNANLKQQNEQAKAGLGATGGAAAGAIIGSAVPGVGTVIGASLGALAGAFGSKLF